MGLSGLARCSHGCSLYQDRIIIEFPRPKKNEPEIVEDEDDDMDIDDDDLEIEEVD